VEIESETMAAAMEDRKTRWGDDVEDDDEVDDYMLDSAGGGGSGNGDLDGTDAGGKLVIPPTHTSRVDSKGIKLVTSYRAHPSNPSQLLKTVLKIRVTKTSVREAKAVGARRKWAKFGQAALDEDTSNVTITSRDDVYLEDPNADTDLQDEDVSKAIAGNLNAFWAKQQRRQLERKYDVDGESKTAPPGEAPVVDGWHKVGTDGKASAAGGAGKYVPPSQRGGVGGSGAKSLAAMAARAPGEGGGRGDRDSNRDQNTIRVTNISEDTSESELLDLFQRFGRISRVYLAKDKETMQSRGFAFVSFVHREDAARAMEKLQGFGYDHLILKLEWARPSAPKDPSQEQTVYRSGYGKALAQDTKEKVSFASNLTK
jgi:translation initiation factor 3 subunit G